MNPREAYQRQMASGWTRIDLLLALYDGAIMRLEQAHDALLRGDAAEAAPHRLRAQRIVVELLSGLNLEHGDVPRNLHRLYIFASRAIGVGTPSQIDGALQVLRTLRDGLLEVRDEAVSLERCGAIPRVDAGRSLQAIG
jgi:flagellin-specific chaperone FliS